MTRPRDHTRCARCGIEMVRNSARTNASICRDCRAVDFQYIQLVYGKGCDVSG